MLQMGGEDQGHREDDRGVTMSAPKNTARRLDEITDP